HAEFPCHSKRKPAHHLLRRSELFAHGDRQVSTVNGSDIGIRGMNIAILMVINHGECRRSYPNVLREESLNADKRLFLPEFGIGV
ncbi:unnamed protein product, partial [marine sediment metagenome]